MKRQGDIADGRHGVAERSPGDAVLGEFERDAERANAAFWTELCGTGLARSIGIHDWSAASLEKFDRAYLAFYPYLLERVKVERMACRRVLEIGLGYGTLGQAILRAGAEYIGLDIAEGPVAMMQHRIGMCRATGAVLRGSARRMPFRTGSMDFVVSIGCLHHTGNVEQAIAEAYRVLAPGGTAILMVYNKYSYRQWMRWPANTLRTWLRERGLGKGADVPDEARRRAYDTNTEGEAAPVTAFLSMAQLRRMLGHFRRIEMRRENNDDLLGYPRMALLPYLGRWWGLDIYVEAVK